MNCSKRVITQIIILLCITIHSVNAESLIVPAEQLPLPLSAEQIKWLNSKERIQIGAMNDWAPINFINANGKPDGFGIALISLLNQRLGGRLTVRSSNWAELYQQVVEKKLDGLLDLTPKQSRESDFNFTQPYLNIPHVIVGRKASTVFLTESHLSGKRLALEKGFGNVMYYRANFPSVTVNEYLNTLEALKAVSDGEADAYIGNQAVVNYFILNNHLNSLKIYSRADKPGSILAIGVRKDWPQLADILQLALDSITTQEFYALLDDVIEKQSALDEGPAVELTKHEKTWLKQHPVIHLGYDPDWSPLEYKDENGDYQGITADFISLIEEKLQIRFVHESAASRSELVGKVAARSADILALMMDTPGKPENIIVTSPYISNAMVIVTKASTEYVPGIEGLLGKKVAVANQYASHEILHYEHPELILAQYETVKNGITAVLRGDAYAFVGNIAVVSHLIQKEGMSLLRISGEVPYRYELGIGVRSDWPELVGILEKTLSSISAHEKAAIFSRWTHVEAKEELPWGWIWSIASILVGIIVVILYWNYLLNKKVQQRTALLEYRSLHDALTGLPNRTLLESQLNQRIALAERNKEAIFGVLFIDLDNFKTINDSLGHSVGDNVLKAIAQRLSKSLRRSDFICRFGGDEFVVVTQTVTMISDIESVCSHLVAAALREYDIDNMKLGITISIGAACYPVDGDCIDDLLKNADLAMYVAKTQGRNRYHLSSSDSGTET